MLESRKGTRTQKRKVVEAIVETSKALRVTERRVRGDVSESHQEEVKKPEEQASAVTQTAEFPELASSTADSPRGELRSMCARRPRGGNCAATQWSTVYQTLRWSLKDSGNRERLHRLSEVYNTQAQHIVMNSQKAPQTVEVSQQQYTGMNDDVRWNVLKIVFLDMD